MAADKRRAFALKKADQAIDCFGHGDWSAGLAKARAALELLEGMEGLQPDDTSILCGGVCVALAACNRVGEALEFFGQHATEIADNQIKDQLLKFWMMEANDLVPGDIVQLGIQLVGVVLGPTPAIGRWRVRVTGSTSDASAAPGPGEAVLAVPDASEESGEELEVEESDMTLLSLRLSEEQRSHWRDLRNDKPELFGQRMKSDNEARWQRLFGAAARQRSNGAGVGAGANAAAQDLGLPLEQSFAATLYELITDCLERAGSKSELTVDILGCRPALELEDPSVVLLALMTALPSTLHQLTVRMCGPEVGCEDSTSSQEVQGGRSVTLEIRLGLYHEVFPSADADLVVAMNAGIGVPQYASMWGPTLDLLATRPRRGLFAITSYTAGEVIREERMLRSRWSRTISLADSPDLADALGRQKNPEHLMTLACAVRGFDAERGVEVEFQRGDLVEPMTQKSEHSKSPRVACVRVSRGTDMVYVGPNKTPGRNRNFGKLVLWAGSPGKDVS